MRTLIQGGGIYVPAADATNYNPLWGNFAWQTGPTGCYQVVPCDGKFSHLYVWTRGEPGAIGSGKSRTLNLYVNGAASALSALIDEGTMYAEDTTDEVSVSAGDLVCIEHVPTNTPDVYETLWCVIFTASTGGQSLVLGCTDASTAGQLSSSATEYANCGTGGARPSGTSSRYREPVPTSGKFSALYLDLSSAPDPGGSSGYTFTLQVNGTDTALAVTITGDSTTGSSVSDVAISAGDIILLKIAPVGTPSVTPWAHWGLRWEPDTAGQGIVLGSTYDLQHATNTEYVTPTTWSISPWATTTPSRAQPLWEATVKNFYVILETAPGAGKSRTFTLRKRDQLGAEEDTDLTLTISDTDTSGSDPTHEFAASDYDQLVVKTVPSGTPDDNSHTGWGYVVELPVVPPAVVGGNPADVLVKNAFI